MPKMKNTQLQVHEIPRTNSEELDEDELSGFINDTELRGHEAEQKRQRVSDSDQPRISSTKRESAAQLEVQVNGSISRPNKYVSQKSDKLHQVWVRLRPTPRYNDNIFEIGEDGTTLKLLVEPKEDRLLDRMLKDGVLKGDDLSKSLALQVDGILYNSSQEETYSLVVEDVVAKAMDGTSGVVMLMGPEVSGKSFTLFGTPKKYEYRGLVPHALERVFEIVELNRDQFQYRIQLAVVEVRGNRIKDLFTLGTSEILRIGKDGAHGMFFKDITSVELALSLLMVALSGQKTIARESYAKFHTLVFVDIHGETISGEEKRIFDSRITFSKIASMPKREMTVESQDSLEDFNADHCLTNRPKSSKSNIWNDLHKVPYQRPKSCCTIKNGPTGESIQIRRDLFQLEQMLMQLDELRRLDRLYTKTQRSGMVMLMKRPNPAPSQYFRHCKLAQCLQDLVSGTSQVRIILTIRPERQCLHSSLEAIRFAQKIKCVPTDLTSRSSRARCDAVYRESDNLRKELLALHEEKIQERLGSESGILGMQLSQKQPSINRLRILEAQDFLEGKIPEIKIVDRNQVKAMFETIRQIWKLAAEHQSEKELEARPSVHQTTQFPDEGKVSRKKSRANSINGSRRQSVERKKRVSKGSKNSMERLPAISEEAQENNNEAVIIAGHQGTNLIDSTHALHADDPIEAWREFVHTFRGEMIVSQIKRQSSAHDACLDEINGNLEPVCNIVRECLHKISALLLRDTNLNEVNTEGDHGHVTEVHVDVGAGAQAADITSAACRGHVAPLAELGVLDANCDEFFHKMLQLCRSALEQHDQIIKQSKADCERLFAQFSHRNPAEIEEHLILAAAPDHIGDHVVAAENVEAVEAAEGPRMSTGGPDFDTLQGRYMEGKHYEEISVRARRIAKQLMKYYSPRPTWIS